MQQPVHLPWHLSPAGHSWEPPVGSHTQKATQEDQRSHCRESLCRKEQLDQLVRLKINTHFVGRCEESIWGNKSASFIYLLCLWVTTTCGMFGTAVPCVLIQTYCWTHRISTRNSHEQAWHFDLLVFSMSLASWNRCWCCLCCTWCIVKMTVSFLGVPAEGGAGFWLMF